jgi:hypothetical protein
MAKETCLNCGCGIGDLETPFIWNERVVCRACYAKLQPNSGMRNRMVSAVAFVAVIAIVGGGAFWLAKSKFNPTPRTQASANQLNALTALKRLQAKVEIGVNFSTYSDSLANTWADVKALTETSDPLANSHLTECLAESIDDYKAASDSWDRIVAPQDDDLDRRLAVDAAKIDAMYDGPRKSMMALANEQQIERKKIIDESKSKLVRLASWQKADYAIAKAEAIIAGDAAKEAELQALISKSDADLKSDLGKLDDQESTFIGEYNKNMGGLGFLGF